MKKTKVFYVVNIIQPQGAQHLRVELSRLLAPRKLQVQVMLDQVPDRWVVRMGKLQVLVFLFLFKLDDIFIMLF